MSDIFLSARGEKYKTEALARKNIPAGYRIEQDDEGFYGVKDTQDVYCYECGQSHFHTTDQHDPESFANPAMLKMKEPYAGWGWEQLPADPTMGYGCLVCPECGAALAPSGKLKVI